MKRYFWICLIFVLSLKADSPFLLSSLNETKNLTPYMCYYPDINHSLTLPQALSSQNFQPLENNNFGTINYPIWTKCTLKNDTSTPQKVVVMNLLANIDYLDIWLLKQSVIVDSFSLGDRHRGVDRNLPSRYCALSIDLLPQEEVTLYTKNANPNRANIIQYQIRTQKDFLSFSLKDSLFLGLFAGGALALIIYNLTLFFSLKRPFFLFYSSLGLSLLWYQLSLSGILYALNFPLETGVSYPLGVATSFFMILFNLSFFNLSANHKKITYFFYFLAILHLIILLLAFFSCNSFLPLGRYAMILGIVTLISLLGIAILAFFHQWDGAIFFGLAQITLITGHLWQLLTRIFHIPTDLIISTYIVMIGSFIDIIFLAIAIGQKIHQLDTQRKTQEKLLTIHARFSSMGKLASSIAHQWRHPVTHMGTLITLMETMIRRSKTQSDLSLLPHLTTLQNDLHFVAHTMEEISNFYTPSSSLQEVNIYSKIIRVCELLENKKDNIELIIECDKNLSLVVNPYAFMNTLLILVDNAMDVCHSKKIDNPMICIRVHVREESCIVEVEDNAHGFDHPISNDLFDPFITSKHEGDGLGLPIAKMLVEEKLLGDIKAQNARHGAIFTVTLPLKHERES